MTNGRVVVLGPTGRNFAAGMSGGIAYVLDLEGDFAQRCNLEMVDLEHFEGAAEERYVRFLVERHVNFTDSGHARGLLERWTEVSRHFVKVMPLDYRRVLTERADGSEIEMVQHG
jgi:glutamate synthase (ferredoxin)